MNDQSTEEKILQAAEKEFIENGYDGTRMQAIANKAGINKALLHYYYRSKDKLFLMVFKSTVKHFAPKFTKVLLQEDLDFFDKIRVFVKNYILLVQKNSHLPGFVIHELSKKNSSFSYILQEMEINIQPIFDMINAEIEAGRIIKIEPKQLILNVVSLSVFPFVAAPIAQHLLFKDDSEGYAQAMNERAEIVSEFIIKAIKTT